MRILLLLVGIVALAMGLLWMGQGLGYIMWPSDSFMLRHVEWTWYGAALSLIALVILIRVIVRKG